MNDRALRHAVIGLGGPTNGIVREEHWVIIPASEIMAILALSTSREDLEQRLGRIIVGASAGESRSPIRARDLKASGAMAMLLKDALAPNLVQTLEGGPAILHAGPFGNIAHGCNSILATRAGLALGDVVITEAGFGSDLGAEKFFDIKCRVGGLNPEAAVLVATVRSLKMQGGADKRALGVGDLAALERGLPHLEHHIRNVRQFGVPVVVAINRFIADTDAELAMVNDYAQKLGVKVALCEVWEKGGEGGEALAREVARAARGPHGEIRADLRRDPAGAREDRDDRHARVRRRRRRLLAGGRAGDRSSGERGPAPHAGLHGEDAVFADRRPDAARQADRLSHHGHRGLRIRGRGFCRRQDRATS